MTNIMRLLMVVGGLATACGPGNGDDADGDADADADADGDADGEVDCGGTDVLDVRVVARDPPYSAAIDAGWEGAAVVVDCAAGRLRATTDAEGMAHFAGLDFANDPPDVSAYVPGQPMWTRVAVGHDGEEIPDPFTIDFGSSAPPPSVLVAGSIVRTAEGSEVYCWCDGSGQTRAHSSPTDGFLGGADAYAVPAYTELLPARAACLEYGEGDAGPQTLLAYGEAPIGQGNLDSGDGPEIVLASLAAEGEVQRLAVTVRHLGFDADPYLANRRMHVFVEDQDQRGLGVAIGLEESSERGDTLETFHVAWVPGARRGTPVVTLQMDAEDGRVGWGIFSLPVEEVTAEPIEIHAPAVLTMTNAGGQHTVQIAGTPWAQDFFVATTRFGVGYWWWRIPAGLDHWDLPAPPDDGTLPAALEAFVGAYRYDGTPAADDMLEVWWDAHLRERCSANDVPLRTE